MDGDVANIDTDDAEMNARIDVKWHKISLLKHHSNHQQRYPFLCKVMKAIFVSFHANADCEHIFSVVQNLKQSSDHL